MRRRGLAFKLSLLIVAGGVLVLALMLAYNYRVVRAIIVRNAGDNARALTLATVNRVDAVLKSTQKVPQSLANVLDDATYTEADLTKLLRAAVEANPEVYGATIAFEPYAFDAQSLYFAPYFYKRKGAIAFTHLGSDTYRYFSMDWYRIPKERNRPAWTEPYFDEGGGGIIMSTYSVPFYRSIGGTRRFMGVVTADVSLEWLRDIVSSIHISQTGYAFLLSKNGTLVTYPKPALVMHETIFTLADARHDDRLHQIGHDMINGSSGLVLTHCIDSTEPCWLAYAPVPANGWSLGAMFPENELLADVTSLNRNMFVLSALGSVFLLVVVVAVARSITGPLTALTQASEDLARGNLEGTLPAVASNDEVGRLTAAFGRMQQDLKRYISDLKDTSAARERAATQLEEYSRTLEQKVDERTRELRDKNTALETTLVQLKATQEQLVVHEKLASLGALTAGIAHEIKNPLNFVTNFAVLSADIAEELRAVAAGQKDKLDAASLADIGALLDDLQQNVAKIIEHGRRADDIVRGMLQHSQDKPGEREPTDLNALVAEYTNLAYHGMRGQDPSFHVALETEYDPSVGTIASAPHDLGRALVNIVNNACYAAYEKRKAIGDSFEPTVWVRTKDLGDRVEIRMRDNGSGVPEAMRGKVFNPFFTTKPAGKGTGLGLSIAHDVIVRQHQGELRLETADGQFAEFVVVLPRAA